MKRRALDAFVTVLSIAGELADNLWRDKQRDSLGITALWREIGRLNAKLDDLGRRYEELKRSTPRALARHG
jgi:hypothetical protein